MASLEYKALQRSTATLCDNISAATRFSSELLGKGLIAPQLARNCTQILGVPVYNQVARLLQAVEAEVRANREKFWKLVEILSEEPALEDSVTVLTNALKTGLSV